MGNNTSEINPLSSDINSCFVNIDKLTVSYINEEGNEITILNGCQLQETVRVLVKSYWSNNLKLLFCHKDAKTNNQQFVTEAKMSQTQNAKSKEKSCPFDRDSPPVWFPSYMQKFRQELMDEVKSSIHKAVFDASNALKTKQEVASSLDHKNESESSFKTRRKSKKITDKYLTDPMPKKLSHLSVETSILKKFEKFHSRRLDGLELRVESKLGKLDKMVKQSEGKRKLVEKKQQSTSTEGEKSERSLSAIFLRNNLSLEVLGTSTFSLNIAVRNNGTDTWKCNELRSVNHINSGVVLDQPVILLPPLKPLETHAVMLTGRVVSDEMFYVLQMRVFAGLEPVSPIFTCRVDVRHARFDYPRVEGSVGGSKTQTEARTDISIEFDKHVVANTQKKIEENITEIEKMLHDIDLLRTTEENSSGKEDRVGHAKEKDSRVKLLTKDCGPVMNSAEDNQEDKEEKEGKLTWDSNSDSDLSILCVSEEEENFVVVPSPSQSPIYSPMNEEENHRVTEDEFVKRSSRTIPPVVEELTKLESNKREQKGEVSLVCPSLNSKIVPLSEEIPEEYHRVTEDEFVKRSSRTIPPVVEELTKLESNKREVNGEMKYEREISPPGHTTTTKSRKAPFREEIPQSKSKKMKSSKRTEYSFPEPSTSAQSAFSPQTDGPFEWRPTTFTFTGEKEAKTETSEMKVPVRDSLGRVIYAVHRKGHCQPVETILRSKERENSEEKRNESESETPAINILSNAVMNGASNVASLAMNTAKSVINNLQSAFVKDGVSGDRVGDAATMEEGPSMEYLLCLYEMGFSDLDLNRKLLRLHNNNMEKVVEELVYLNMVYNGEE